MSVLKGLQKNSKRDPKHKKCLMRGRFLTQRRKEAVRGFASKVTWTQSVQGAVATWSNDGVKNVRKYRMLITDQVATAPCTDRVQE